MINCTTMSKIVVKFGGSNLKNGDDISKIIRIIKQYNQGLTIVVSAIYGITNELDNICYLATKDKSSIDEFIHNIREKYNTISSIILKTKLNIEEYNHALNSIFNSLEQLLLGIHYLKYIPEQTYDKVLTTGEVLSSIIIHHALKETELKSKILYPEDIGLITNGVFKNAEINLDKSSINTNIDNDAKCITIIPGFYGVSENGIINLLGRGGTDYSASAIAHCLNADYLDIWKDVNGFCTADPRYINNVISVPQLSYTEAAELAYFGAKILHPSSIAPAQSKNIPIRILDIRNESSLNPVSIISSNTCNTIKSLSSSNDFGIIKLKGPSIGLKHNILAKVANILGENDINIGSVITSQVAINILLNKENISKAQNLIKGLKIPHIIDLDIITDISLLAIVGEGITETSGIAGRIFTAIANRGINVKTCSVGASVVSIYIIIDRCDHTIALQTIHQELFHTNNN